MDSYQSTVDQAISSLDSLSEVLSKLLSPVHGESSWSLTAKDLEIINVSRNHFRRFLLHIQNHSSAGRTGIGMQNHSGDLSGDAETVKLKEELQKLQLENKRLTSDVEVLQKEVRELHDSGGCNPNSCQHTVELMQTRQELSRCKETLQAMKADRRRLKSDKLDLLGQMKQLYHTLEDKESELREFIRNYEQRMTDASDQAKKLAVEKEELEQERNAALEQCRLLWSKLEIQNGLVGLSPKKVVGSKTETKMLSNAVRSSFSDDSVLKLVTVDGHYSSSGDDLPPYQEIYVLDMSNQSPVLPRASSISEGHLQANIQKALQKSSKLLRNQSGNIPDGSSPHRERSVMEKMSSTKTMNESPLRQQRSLTLQAMRTASVEPQNANRVSFLSLENYEDKLRTIAEARELAIGQWKANHVLSWLELDMSMTAYGSACADNIKSGKVLLGLSDAELDSALRLQTPLHRRKLRLAIEELRDPSSIQFPLASKIGHTWVSLEWVCSLGLPQYVRAFEEQLVDGRLLNVLTKKDLDKYLNVHKKFHQLSIAYGIELLRLLGFDKEQLQDRRNQSQEHYSDPLVWTNEQVIEWANHIDLHEYSQNLKESGIHGAVLVFDQNFTSDVFASLLGIPTSKSYVRRHLSAELDAIIRLARTAIEESRSSRIRGSSHSSFTRSYSGGNRSETEMTGGGSRGSGSGRKLSFRGSIGRAFARRSAKDLSCDRQKETRELTTKSSSNSDLSTQSASRPIVSQ